MRNKRDLDIEGLLEEPEPVGFAIRQDRSGYYACMLMRYRGGHEEEGAFPVGRSRRKRTTEWLATREWRKMHHEWLARRDDVSERVLLVPPVVGPRDKAGA